MFFDSLETIRIRIFVLNKFQFVEQMIHATFSRSFAEKDEETNWSLRLFSFERFGIPKSGDSIKLGLIQVIVEALLRHQALVGALLHHPACIQHQNVICRLNGR